MDSAVWVGALSTLLAATWRLATPLIYAAVGETFTERAGVINIGLEGVMLCGGLAGFLAAYYTGSLTAGVLAALGIGLLLGLLFAFFAVTLKANQIVIGTALNLAGLGVTGFIIRVLNSGNALDGIDHPFRVLDIPVVSGWPLVGTVLFQHNLMTYATVLLVPAATWVLYHTGFGLALRAAGEHPKAADTAGINVSLHRYAATMLGAMLTALGGAYLSIAQTNVFGEGMTAGRGFIALAVVVFGRWTPLGVTGASLLFGLFYALQLRLQAIPGIGVPYQLFQALPYLVTILTLLSLRGRSAAPKALGVAYEK